MTSQLTSEQQVQILLGAANGPLQTGGSCIVRVVPRPNTRVARVSAATIRIAFVPAEVVLLVQTMNRACPRLHVDAPPIRPGCNEGYVPGEPSRPFLVPCGGRQAAVRIGVEIVGELEHPVVELTPKRGSRVHSAGGSIDWMPNWTEFRVLVAEFEETALCMADGVDEKPTP